MHSETEQASAMIDYHGRGRTNREITRSILDEWRASQTMVDMADADEYYAVRNVGIRRKTRDYFCADGHRYKNRTLSNAKIPSAFLRTNIRQKVNYALTKPFVLSVEGGDEARGEVYLQEWTEFITADLRRTLKRMMTNAVSKGVGWGYVTIADGRLQVFDMEPRQVYPAWADAAHTELDAAVRDYTVVAYVNNERTEVRKVEYWGRDIVERYVETLGELMPDKDDVAIDAHMRLPSEDGVTGIAWGRVPFVALKGTDDEMPMLNVIRRQMDAYDLLQSKSVDGLADDIDAVLKLVGVSPEMGELTRVRQTMQNARVVSVDAGGDADYIKNTPDITAVQAKLEALKKDIREFGQTVDTQDIRFGSNPSGVALKSMYQDLDIYVNGLESEFAVFVQGLKYFFDRWLEFRGIGTAVEWERYTLAVKFDRDMLINSTADIQETVMLASTGVSQETVDEWNPAVKSHAEEEARRAQEAQQGDGVDYPLKED